MSRILVLYVENYCENQDITMRLLVVTRNAGLMMYYKAKIAELEVSS